MTVGRIFNIKGFKTVAEIGVNLRGLLLGFKSFSPSE
jgi:hypothetical protein